MKKASYKIKYNRRKNLLSDGTAPIEIEVCIDRKQKFIKTGLYVKPEQWDQDGKKIIKHSKKLNYNIFLKTFYNDLMNFESELNYKGQYLTIEKLNIFLNRKNKGPFNFLTWVESEIEKNTQLRESSIQQHNGMLKALKDFGRIVEFNDLNYDKIVEFDNWLRSDPNVKRQQSTIHNFHKRLKVYVNKAIASDLIDTNPYFKFKVDKGKSKERRFLTNDELKILEEKEITIKRLEVVRDIFIFQCYTGLSYADLAVLSEDNIFMDDEKDLWIKINRTKTDEGCSILLLPKALAIIDKYKTQSELLPITSNQKYNHSLKDVQEFCGIEKRLTSHVARHTFATTVTLAKGVSIEAVSKALGHSNIGTTQIYSKIVDSLIKDEMNKLKE